MPRSASTVLHVVGARPNFVKMAPVISALDGAARRVARSSSTPASTTTSACPTRCSATSGFPAPDVFLGVGSGTHGEQTARVLDAFEERPARACARTSSCVGGDVNSTLACALAAAKLGIPVAHVEAGLRSFDWTMPEEINRVLTDRLSDLLLHPQPRGASRTSPPRASTRAASTSSATR